MLKEFKEFAIKGNMIDLAVGVIIGAAFGKIVDSFVKDIVMPPIGAITPQGGSFSQWGVTLGKSPVTGQETKLMVGAFLDTALQFIIVAFALFMIVKAVNKMKKAEPEAAPAPEAPPKSELLLEEIRDLLKSR